METTDGSCSDFSDFSDASDISVGNVDSGVGTSVASGDDRNIFRQRVMAANNLFAKKMTSYISWLQSDDTNHVWPVNYMKSKNTYRAIVRSYFYDSRNDVLYHTQKHGPDGIREY